MFHYNTESLQRTDDPNMEMNGVGDFMFPFRGRLYRRLELGNPSAILSTSASADDNVVATCSTDTKVMLWDLSTGKRSNSLQGHTAEVTTCCFGDDLLATGSRMAWLYCGNTRLESEPQEYPSIK